VICGQCDVGSADVEEVFALELEVAKIQRTVTRDIEHSHFDGMRAIRKNLFRNEFPLRIDGNLAARQPDRVARRYAAALNLDRAATQRNPVMHEVAFAVRGQQLLRHRVIDGDDFRRRHLAVQPQRMRSGFVEIALRVINAQQKLEVAFRARESLRCGLPFRVADIVEREDRVRRSFQ